MWILPLMLTMSAQADDCDTRVLTQELRKAGPATAAAAFSALADCDPTTAKREARGAFDDMNPNHDGYKALVKAVDVGVTDPAVAWVDGLQSDSRSHAMAALGKACADSEEVQKFFVGRAESLGDDFWDQRWYKGLSNCGAAPIADLLWGKLEAGVGGDYSLYFGVLEAYARSAGAEAVPNIQLLIEGSDDQEVQSNLVASFGDASQLGSAEGANSETMAASVKAILAVAGALQPKALKQARQTLLTLDAEQESDELAGQLFADLKQPSGDFMWATIVVETATCKNGKVTQRAQTASVREPGNTWPDQLKDKVEASTKATWTLDLAERCKGTGEIEYLVPSKPFKTKTEVKAWFDAQLEEARQEGVKKFIRVDNEQILI